MPVNGHCDILEFQYDDPDYFHDDEVLELNPVATRRILAAYAKDLKGNEENTEQILRLLKQINAPIASTFVTKSSILPSLKFRLISQVPKPKTFVALSYTCGVQDDKSIGLRDIEQAGQFVLPERFRLPISGTLSQVILREQQPAEGIWCDQLCITQQDVDEKAVSIGLMDGVYRSARMVCVAMDDIEMTTKEAKVLECYGRAFADNARNEKIPHPQHKNRPTWLHNELLVPPFMMQRPVMQAAYMKLAGSRWFKRAWCYHEYILSQDHCLFVKCAGKTTWVLRISALFLSHLRKLSMEIDGSNFRFSTSFRRFRDGEIQRPHVLETWHGRLVALALASRLPLALSTFGDFTPRNLAQGSSSWIQMWSGPGEEDGVNIQEVTSEGCMPSTAENFHEYIELPMQSALRVLEFVSGDHRYEVLGSALLKACLMEFKNDAVAPDTRAYLSTMLQQSPASFMPLTKYLGCILEVGIVWVSDTWFFRAEQYYNLVNVKAEYMSHLLTHSGGANPRCLTRPEGSQLSEDQAIERIAAWLTSDRSHRIVAEVLLAFAYTFVQASLMGWRGKDDPTYLHCLIAREPVTGSSYITMLPKSWPTQHVAIPVELADNNFEIFQRLWVLTKRDDIQDGFDRHYRLRGKQVIVGPPIKKTFVKVEAFRIHGPLQCDDVEVVRPDAESSRMGELSERMKRDYEPLCGELEAGPPVLDWRMFGNVIHLDEHGVV